MPILPSSSRIGSGTIAAPLANPDSFTIPLGSPETVLDILANDNLRGQLPEDVSVIADRTELEGTLTVEEGSDAQITYIPPASGTARLTLFEYRIVGAGGSSNTVTVTITLVVAVPPVYEAGVYETGVYQ